jgi:L-iditol 2-dehydrogenase
MVDDVRRENVRPSTLGFRHLEQKGESMQVARVHGANDMRLYDEPIPTPSQGEALMRVTAVGICGSDLHWLEEGGIGNDRVISPFVLGHECAGVIESGPRRGQRVAIDPAIACGQCEFCEQGNPNLCKAMRFAGHYPVDGALRQYMTWPERCLVPLPESMTDVEGAMLEPLGVGLYSVELGQVHPGMSVSVFGCGTIGLFILQVAREVGATQLFATELPDAPHRIKIAQSFGATVFEADHGREVNEIKVATSGRGVDVAFEAAGDPEAVEASIAAVKPGGRVILVGIPTQDRISFTASVARGKDLALHVVHRMKHTYPHAIQLVKTGRVDVKSLVTHRFPLGQVIQAYAVGHRREGIKVVIEPSFAD